MDDATTAARSAAERRAEAVAPARQGRLAEAERALDALLRDAPDDVEALNMLAVCAHGRGDAERALGLLSEARRQHPAHAYLTEVEREALVHLVGAIGGFNRAANL